MVCPTCGELQCEHDIQMGPAIPVALVCNLIPELDNPEDPLCNTCAGTMCYKTEGGEQEVETVIDNLWTQVVTNQITQYQQLLTGGDTVTFTMEHLTPPGGGNIQAIHNTVFTAASVDGFELSWDHALVGQFIVLLEQVDAATIINLVPAPDSVVTVGETRQMIYNDITGITDIQIAADATVTGADIMRLSIDESIPLTSVANIPGDTIELLLVCNVCNDPPTTRYVDMSTGEEVTDSEIIANLYNCDIDVTEERICYMIGNEQFSGIKRTYYASDPVDVFIGPNGVIVNPDSWRPGDCDIEYAGDACYLDENDEIRCARVFKDDDRDVFTYYDMLTEELLEDPILVDCNEGIIDVGSRPVIEACYLKETGDPVETSLATDTWTIDTDYRITGTVTLDDDTSVNFVLTRQSGLGTVDDVPCDAATPLTNAFIHDASSWRFSWDRDLSGPLTWSLFDVDPAESVTFDAPTPAPDSTVSGGDAAESTYTWNDASVLNREIYFSIAATDCVGAVINMIASLPVSEPAGIYVLYNCDGTRTFRDKITNAIVTNPALIECVKDRFETVIGYIFDCLRFDNQLPINSNATFNDSPVGTNEIIFENVNVALLVRGEIVKAQRVQSQEELHGQAVTPIVIYTDSGETYSFNPDALQFGTSNTLVIDETGVIAWGINQVDLVTAVHYSVFDSCDCKAVEVLQRIVGPDEAYLVDVFNITYEQETGQKISLLDENLLLDFLTLGPFAGPCPETPQVMEVNPLCCNDDLVEGSEEIANQRLAWLDASDDSLMRSGGAPITGTTGEDVDEVWDKLQPGIAPSFVVPANVAPGDDDPPTAPTFVEEGLNSLSVLDFDKNDFDRLRLDTGNPTNGPFTLFYLVSASDLVLDSQACILAVGPDNSDGDEYHYDDGAWQLSRDGTEPSFIFRITGPSIPAGGPGTDPLMLVQTGPYSSEKNPSDGPTPTQNDTYQLERAISTEAEFFNGQFHLITVSYDDVNQILSAYFDGELRLQMDMSVMVPQFQMGSDYFRVFGNRNGAAYLSGQLAEMFFADSLLSPEETAEVNSYLICKWGIDPSIVAGGLGDLELDTPGSYSAPSPFVQIVNSDGTITYRNTLNGQEFELPPTPGLALCGDPSVASVELQKFDWMKQLCDRIDTIIGLDLFFFNDANQEVQRVNAFTGDVEDSHSPDPAIDWAHGTVFDASGGATGYYYLYDGIASEWHRYDAGNIAAGSVNLGVFGGDPIVGSFTFGAFDPTTGLAYVGFVDQTRYEVDFNTSTITALPVFNGHTGAPSSLSITETGLHYMTAILAGAHSILHTVDVATGTCTPTGFFSDIPLNGADYDQDTLTGFYGIGIGNLYHWTELDGSDLEVIAPAVFSGTLAVGNTVISTERVEFQRVYHKDLVSGEVTSQDHDLEGVDYEVQGEVEHCPSAEAVIETSCDDPLHVQQCIETWSERLCDVGFREVLGEDQVFIEIAPQVNINQVAQNVGFSGGEGPVTGIVEAVFAVEPDVQYDYLAGHGGAGSCAGGPATILVEIIDDSGAGAVLASQTLQYVGGVDTPGVDLGPTTMPFTSTTGNVMVRVSDQTPLTNICDAIFYWYDFQSTNVIRTEFQRVYHKNLQTLNITAQDHDFRGNLYTLQGEALSCLENVWSEVLCDEDCVTFNRVYHKTPLGVVTYQDLTLMGMPYVPIGIADFCDRCGAVESHLVNLGDGETWTPASLAANHFLTGLSINVIIEAADSSITDADGVVVTNIPAGLSMSWNVSQDFNDLVPPQSIFAGTGGRIIINMTVRDES